jgi:response regulator RpfG family c-di-GMP phosphodiesterase
MSDRDFLLHLVQKVGWHLFVSVVIISAMKILYAEDQEMLQEMYSMEMEADLDCEVVNAKDGEQAINLLKKSHDYDLIISDYNMPNINGGQLYTYVQDNCPSIPFILTSGDSIDQHKEFSSFKSDNRGNHSIEKPFSVDALIQYIQSLFADKKTKPVSGYCRVRISLFSLFNGVPTDVFLKISDKKYIKVINKDDLYSSDTIEKYLKKKISYLYIEKQYFKILLDEFQNLLKSTMETKNADGTFEVEIETKVIELIHSTVKEMGVSEQVVKMTDTINRQSVKMIESNKSLKGLFSKLMAAGTDRHSYCQMVSYIGAGVLNKMDWSSHMLLQKISFAALMQDISLEQETLTFIGEIDSSTKTMISPDELELVKKHPEQSVKLLSSLPNFAREVEDMILYHHEKPDGSGFPLGKNFNSLSQTSCIFITACEFSRRAMLSNKKGNFEEIVAELKPGYSKGNFKKPFEGLEKLISLQK